MLSYLEPFLSFYAICTATPRGHCFRTRDLPEEKIPNRHLTQTYKKYLFSKRILPILNDDKKSQFDP